MNRKSVQHALKRAIERLKLTKEVPPNGAVLLSGYFETSLESIHLDDSNDCVFFFEPPLPVKHFVYYCDKSFHLEEILPLFEHGEDAKKFAVCVVRGTDSEIFQYLPDVNIFKPLGSVQGSVRNSHGRGGFSQNRFQRLRDGDVHEMVKKIAFLCERTCFTLDKIPLVQSLILVGPGERKRQVAERLQNSLAIPENFIRLVTSDGTDSKSLEDARAFISDELCPQEYRAIEKEIRNLIETKSDLLIFGPKEGVEYLELQALQKIYILKTSITSEMDRVLQGTSAEVLCVNICPILEQFGGVVGVKWY